MTTVAPLRPEDPRRLGPYELVGRVGEGGMGAVFLGVNASGTKVAIKVVLPRLAWDERFRARFRREVEAARRVARFCTAPVLDADLDAEPPYVVTEYIEGRSLEAAVESDGPLAASTLEAVAVSVASALVAIHAAGVIHRDLKPSNVLLSETGPRVIDFGIAGATDFTRGMTVTGRLLGTPGFMAPEQLGGRREVNEAVDVFAWGCLIAYAGTGRPPFSADNLLSLAYQVASAEPDLEGLDPAIRVPVERALAKDPSARPTARALLAQLLSGLTTVPSPRAEALLSASEPAGPKAAPTISADGGKPGPAVIVPATPPSPARSADPEAVAAQATGRAALPSPGRRGPTVAITLIACTLVVCALIVAMAFRYDDTGRIPAVLEGLLHSAAGAFGDTPTTGNSIAGDVSTDAGGGVAQGPSSARLGPEAAPGFLVDDWRAAGARQDCLPLIPTVLGDGDGGTARRANFGTDAWALVYDLPSGPGRRPNGEPCEDCGRGAFGVASAGHPPDSVTPAGRKERRWPDGSSALSGPSTITEKGGLHHRATIVVNGQNCVYEAWSFLGERHLEQFLDGLMLVQLEA
jgi:hypothetical protein